MIPVVTPEEMAAVDAAAPEPVGILVRRAGGAVARAAVQALGGAYGRRVVVVAGKGNNGADGREAARRLRRAGARVTVLDAGGDHTEVPPCDLVIDAAYGTGFRGDWRPPHPRGAPVLAVDIPSGVDGRTGEASPEVLAAVRTVTFAALKPGLLLGRGPDLAGEVVVADIGLDVGRAKAGLVTDGDVGGWLPSRPRQTHKWRSAVWVVAGSPGMSGAATLAARGALRAGAGYVRLSTPGA
ncbi:MAG: bifunctional ADP-dependent NAD(P)H-hydrate dehydratase/NAD(P)H-hydrate epimerase, partial [Actinomycetota bacterium]|nr:bifunctional ADP-dependent NAD(P)H-hydrate dehydratase/NAD(P)H-hydrate epimerase [Actinomycetota bacterium]